MDFTHIAERLSASPVTAVPALFVAGLLTSLTPCVYPMIPITAAIVGGSSVGVPPTRGRTVALTLSYVLGLSVVYSTLGLFAGLSGTLFGSVSSNPWLYFGMANLLLIAALGMLDVIPVRLPSAIMQRLHRDINATVADKEMAERLLKVGAEPLTMSMEDFNCSTKSIDETYGGGVLPTS